MWNWLRETWEELAGTEQTVRELTDSERCFIKGLIRGDSMQLRPLRAQVDEKGERANIRRSRRRLRILLERWDDAVHSCVPCFNSSTGEPITQTWKVSSSVGDLEVSLRIPGAIQEVEIAGDGVSELRDLRLLLEEIEFSPLEHSLIVDPRDPIVDEWHAVFGNYLDQELSIPIDRDRDLWSTRHVTPTRGADPDEVRQIGTGLNGAVIEQFIGLMLSSKGVNFFGVHLGVSPIGSNDSSVFISHGIRDVHGGSTFLAILPVAADACAYFRGAYHEEPEEYANSLPELFDRVYGELKSGLTWGTEAWR